MMRQNNAIKNSENGGKNCKPASFSPRLWVKRYGYADASAFDNGCKMHHTPFVRIIVVRMLAVIFSDGVVKRQEAASQLRAFHCAAGGNERIVMQFIVHTGRNKSEAQKDVADDNASRLRMVFESG
jgi:hypothetical protein